jgi:putative heme-binding domain-containing protein
MARLAANDPSPVVRLYLAAVLQRLPLAERRPIAEPLLARAEDARDPALPLMLWFGVEPLGVLPTRIPLLREFMARKQAETRDDLRELVERIATDVEARAELLKGMRDGLKGRAGVKKPAGWDELGLSGVIARDINAAFGDPRALEELRQILAEPKARGRAEALDTLLGARDPRLPPLLRRLLRDPALRGSAIRALAAYDDPATADALLEVYPQLGLAERRDALNTLAARPAWAKAALARVPRPDFTAAVIRQISEHKELAEDVARLWGAARPSSEERRTEIDQLRRDLLKGPPGDPAKGKAVFAKTCAQCHVLFGEGGKVGPDLTGGQRSDLDYLLVNILDPSAVVGRDYTATTVRTKSGRVVTGIVKGETADTLTLATENDTVTLPTSDVRRRRAPAERGLHDAGRPPEDADARGAPGPDRLSAGDAMIPRPRLSGGARRRL